MQNLIDRETLLEILRYDSNTGKFTRIKQTGPNALVGSIAGGIDKSTGYWCIKINNKNYSAHRLAWLYMTGEWPKETIDHINTNKSDNRWINLREASRSQNMQNIAKPNKNNSTGFLGVIFNKKINKYTSKIRLNKKTVYTGTFKTAEEAHEAYLIAKRELHPFGTI